MSLFCSKNVQQHDSSTTIICIKYPAYTHAYLGVFRAVQFINSECHDKARNFVIESVTQGSSAWLRFEPDVVALSILLLAIGTTSERSELITRVSF